MKLASKVHISSESLHSSLQGQHRSIDKARCGGSAGVLYQGKCTEGFPGNLGEPNASLRARVERSDPTETDRACLVYASTRKSAKKREHRKVSKPRKTEGKEKGEGSLSILIVLIERWEIGSMKATE